jgi:hypothetical protein
VQVDPVAQHVAPVHPCPPHWPYTAEQLTASGSEPVFSGFPTSAEQAASANAMNAGTAKEM